MGDNRISRRDFLKLLALVPASISVQPLIKPNSNTGQNQPHIIIIVYDAWSARNTSLYGYPRNTMPNLEKFAQKALVYHRHYAAGNFTVPGTASLLTGVYPWKHRAFALGGKITSEFQEKQIFNLLTGNLNTIGFAQNKYADLLLSQNGSSLKSHYQNNLFNLERYLNYNLSFLKNDKYIAFSSLDRLILSWDKNTKNTGSLFLGPINETYQKRTKEINQKNLFGNYERDLLPEIDEQFLLSSLVDGTIQILKDLKEPSLVYIHLLPPHEPFRPKQKFLNQITKNSETLIEKPIHYLSEQKKAFRIQTVLNKNYDAYLMTWDNEVSKLFDFIELSGLKMNSYIFLTSDHGQLFERGESFHMTPLLNDPVVHIPLIVSTPGRSDRTDIYSTTSAVDILPTIASITGLPKPYWTDGEVLPGLGGISNKEFGVFSVEAKKNSSHAKLSQFSLAYTKENYRLILYQYNGTEIFEFYNLSQDPEELENINPDFHIFGKQMKKELIEKISEYS